MIRHRQRGHSMWSRASFRGGAAAGRRRKHWVLERLEERVVLSGSPTTYVVGSTTDSGASTSTYAGDLLYCITQANANPNPSGSVITFDPTLFRPGTLETITLSGTLDLSETAGPEVIQGNGATAVTISGNNAVQVFSVSSGVTASLSGVTISDGLTTQAYSGGGGIDNAGTLTVADSVISGNTADAAGAGGGGIYNTGTLTVSACTFADNSASPQMYDSGGGIDNSNGNLTVNACTFSGNSGLDGGGIVHLLSGTVTVYDSTFTENTAVYEYSNDGGGGEGGGIYYFGGTATTITDCIFSDNSATAGGGIDDFECPMTISGTMFSSNSADDGDGGGLSGYSNMLTVLDSTFSSNTAGGFGGGIYINGGALTLTNTTVSGNTASQGGGIFDNADTFLAVNSTIAFNVVTNNIGSGGQGGGLAAASGKATLNNTIVAQNTEGTGSSARADDISNYGDYYGAGALSSQSANNLIGTGGTDGLTNGTNGNQVGVADPGLGVLASNGGPTQTISLLASSPAINAGNNTLAVDANGKPLTSDGRGPEFARVVNKTVDIGAFETGNSTGYEVDLTSDTGAGSGGVGDLLYCITQANANTNKAGSLIEFAPTVFNTATPQTIKLSNTLDLNETDGPAAIDGPGASIVTVSGNKVVEVFDIGDEDVTATLAGLTISGAVTGEAGGGIANNGTLSVVDCTIESNSSEFGGGIYNDGTLVVTGSTIESNQATGSVGVGAGIDNDDGGIATVTDTTVDMNSAGLDGGGIINRGQSTLNVTGSTFSRNTAGESGGGIFNLGAAGGDGNSAVTLTNSNFSDNTAGSSGGGIDNSSGSASITGSTFSSNSAASGGGIYSTGGALTITASTVSDNSAAGDLGPGGGIDLDSGTLVLTNSTIAGNSAQGVGAGIYESSGKLTSVNCTVAYNNEPSTLSGMGGGLDIQDGTATLDNTIIALNTDGTGPGAPADNIYSDGSGTVSAASSHNLLATGGNSGAQNGVNGNQVGVADPGLGALGDNGGPMQTIALLAGSPAIDAGSNALAVDVNGKPLATDQRGTGFPRIVNGKVDIGAFERPLVSASPTVYVVDLTSDTGASTSALAGDLLYCITQANANPNLAGSEITFDPKVFAAQTTITLTSTLDLTEPSGPEAIDGPGANLVTVSGNNTVQVFDVQADAPVTLSGLTIADGKSADGGGIENSGTLTVTNCTLSGNTASSGGGIDNDGGTLTVSGSTFEGNMAPSGGGIANSGMLTVTGSTIKNNFATESTGVGGGIENDESATLSDSSITENSAGNLGGGIDNSGSLTVNNCTFLDNSAFLAGGAVENVDGLTTITDSTLSENSADGSAVTSGGGIDNEQGGNITIAGSSLSDNFAHMGLGGGIYNAASSTVGIASTTVTQTSDVGSTETGAGIADLGTMTVLDCTIANNDASSSAGGIYENDGTLTLTNSTISGNSAVSGTVGGIFEFGGSLTTVNCTIAYNTEPPDQSSGSGLFVKSGVATLDNTIIALNTDGTGASATPDNLQVLAGTGAVSSSSANNLIGAGDDNSGLTNGVGGNQLGVANPGLGTLASNGGPTQTIPLLAGSAAIDAGSNALAVDSSGKALPTDQRGMDFTRIVSEIVDIGAFEVQTPTTNNSAPTVSSILPDQIAVGYSNPLTVTFAGSNFVSGAFVLWNSAALATTYVSPAELKVTVPASDFTSIGTATITVENPPPGGGTFVAGFRVLALPPTVYVSPGWAGDPLGTAVTWADGSMHFVGYDAFSTISSGVGAVAPRGTVDILVAGGHQCSAAPTSANNGLAIELDSVPSGTIPASDTIDFWGGGKVVINGESGPVNDVFSITDSSVYFDADDALGGMTIVFNGALLTREVLADGASNIVYIEGRGLSGPTGVIDGNEGHTDFVFVGTGKFLGDITASTASTLDYRDYSEGVTVKLGGTINGDYYEEDGTATGASGLVNGWFSAIIGSNYNDTLNAGGVEDVALTGGLGNNSLTGDSVSVVESISSSYTLTNLQLTGSNPSFTDKLSGVTLATLTGSGTVANAFNVSGWTGHGSLTSRTLLGLVTSSKDSSATLTNTSLSAGDGMSINLSGISIANLSVSPSAGEPTAKIDASAFSGLANLSAMGTGNAILFGGQARDAAITASGSGNDILIGNSGDDTLTDSGTGRNILIGSGSGGDIITGKANDIVLSGTTKFDSDTIVDIAALDAILAEWTSRVSYPARISKIKAGVGRRHQDAFNPLTIRTDPTANTLSGGINLLRSDNWYIVSKRDSVTKKRNEVETILGGNTRIVI